MSVQGARQRRHPSGFSGIWTLWRHCLCRFGFYPLFVTPFIVIGCLLSLYSTADCQFMKVDVGFTPTNYAWNSDPSVLSGLWYYQSGEPYDLPWNRTYIEGCRVYSNEFEGYFLANDGMWKIARIASLVGGASGILAVVTAILLSTCPVPACFAWAGILLPSVLVAMCAEGAKFLVLDTDICESRMWYPTESGNSPQVANSCTLQRGAYVSFAAIGVYFLCILLICLRTPHRRRLDPDYGTAVRSTTSKKSKDDYLDLERQDTLVLSDRDEREPHGDNVGIGDASTITTLQVANRRMVPIESGVVAGGDDGITPRVANSSKSRQNQNHQSKNGNVGGGLQKSFSFNKNEPRSSWVEFESSKSDGDMDKNGALYSLKKKREQSLIIEPNKSSKRVLVMQKKKSLAASSPASSSDCSTALVVFNPVQQSSEQYNNYPLEESQNMDDAYSNYSATVSNNGDDAYSNFSQPIDTKSVDASTVSELRSTEVYSEQEAAYPDQDDHQQQEVEVEEASTALPESVVSEPVLSEVEKVQSPTSPPQSEKTQGDQEPTRARFMSQETNFSTGQTPDKDEDAEGSKKKFNNKSLRDGYFRVY